MTFEGGRSTGATGTRKFPFPLWGGFRGGGSQAQSVPGEDPSPVMGEALLRMGGDGRRRCNLGLAFAFAMLSAFASPVASIADPLPPIRLQGSTTFAAEILGPYSPILERTTGRSLEVVANKSIWGVFALLEGRIDVAMISAPLKNEIASASKLKPGLDYDSLKEFQIATTRIAFVINPANVVTHLPVATVGRILKGEIVNWRDVGGTDMPIRIVAVKEGGGTVAAVRARFLGEAPLAEGAIRLESAQHVLKVVAQEPGALGIAQLSLFSRAGLHEIVTDTTVEQPLSFVTRGDPSPAIVGLIDAARLAIANAGN